MMGTTMTATGVSLHPEHMTDLHKSGLTDETIRTAGLYSVRPSDLAKLIGFDPVGVQSALCFPYQGTGDYCRVKVFPSYKDRNGHTVKYLQRRGSDVHLYIPASIQGVLQDSTVPLAITEGEKKALALTQAERPCIGIGGLWSWRQDRQPIPELEAIVWGERRVSLYPDSDVWQRPDLMQAVYALGRELVARGALVSVVMIPNGEKGKVGIDDYLTDCSRRGVSPVAALSCLASLPLDHPAFAAAAAWWKQWEGSGSAEQERPFAIRAADAVATPVEKLIEGLLPAGMLALLSGKDKRGKTLLAQEMVGSVLIGEPFLDQFAVRRGPVLAAFMDDPFNLTLERLQTLGIKEHPDLHLVPPTAFDGDPASFLTKMEKAVKEIKPVLIVIDALYQLVPSGANAGNDQARMGPLMGRLNRLAEASGATNLIICHDSKGGGDVAGSHVVRAAAKAILRLTVPAGEETSADDGPPTSRRILRVESKVEAASTWALDCGGCGQWDFLGRPDQVRVSETLEAVRRYLSAGGERTRNEIAEALKKRSAEVGEALNQLCSEGFTVKTVEPVKKGRPRIVYSAKDFRSQAPDQKGTRDQKSDVQVTDSKGDTVTGDFWSRLSVPRPGMWDQKSNSAVEAVFEEV